MSDHEGPFVTLDDVLDDAFKALLAVEQEYIDAAGRSPHLLPGLPR